MQCCLMHAVAVLLSRGDFHAKRAGVVGEDFEKNP